MAAAAAGVPRKGRLSTTRERELLQAALDLVAEVGYEQVTMAELAKRTKSSTATLYRQWESKPNLVIVALKTRADEQQLLADIDTGSLRGDLHALAARAFGAESSSDSMASIWHAVGTDKELLRALRTYMIVPGLESMRRILDRALHRGEIKNSPAIALADRVLYGPLAIQELMTGDKPTPELARDIVDFMLLPALTAANTAAVRTS
ncbi:TetR/AcrR family transcriptional regulator [Yinghuangia sp. ASG 101]|uniref:TetR/AcrR family transcriptional regulator n=1 Tax=Yinghuangia sp. ASG 101 TaxID=2896848 RepID=UPI001E4E1281|nr:TetR/AcrR family transcriptional regulator [Yinghuangia sp. ASG 101]UGQ11504.1 TetR/AcrR family transcriptional regulator [Yinghuangia sp. ASG 101]